MKLVFAPRALQDIDDILAYISARNPEAARNISIAIEYTARLCAENPYIGSKINRPNAYRYPLTRYDYTIFYRVRPRLQIVEMLRVVHGKQVRDVNRIPS